MTQVLTPRTNFTSPTGRRVAAAFLCATLVAACGGSDDDAGGADDAGSTDEAQDGSAEPGADSDVDEVGESSNESATDAGSGVVTIDGADYAFEAIACFASANILSTSGPGTTPDGEAAWIDVSYSFEEDFDSDGETDLSVSVAVEVGKTDRFESAPDGLPDWSAERLDSATLSFGEDLESSYDGSSISGSGSITDNNGVALTFGETVPMTFSASCS